MDVTVISLHNTIEYVEALLSRHGNGHENVLELHLTVPYQIVDLSGPQHAVEYP